ncbi:MAG TPA: hypothetical protein VML55_18260 [Planctomycetaceae bacterium]|nr:hypothetical protein [Planctomycetaceae bacterium]
MCARVGFLAALVLVSVGASCVRTEAPQDQVVRVETAASHASAVAAENPPEALTSGHNQHDAVPAAQRHQPRPGYQAAPAAEAVPTAGKTSSLALFEKRILPIFQSANPSSCSECHLSGVDLKDYIRPTQPDTYASLLAAGLIDQRRPDNSKLLEFISRRPEQPGLVTEQVRQQEYEAFRAWIRAAVTDPELLAATADAEPAGPQVPAGVIRHARQDRVLASFVDNVWSEVGRCAACHSPDRNQKQVKEHGEQVSWIRLRDPEGTLEYMLEAGLIDSETPADSLLLMKPTLQIDHGGGQKMVVGDRTYKQFRRFIDDYAAIVQGRYARDEELPAPGDEVSVVTEIWLKIEGVPAKYDKLLLQADLYRRTDSGWSDIRVATSDRPVFGPKNLWQHSLSLTAPRGSRWAEQIRTERLPPGRYLVRLYVDQSGRLQKDFTAELGEDDFVGQVEVESRWPAGYGQMTVVKFPAP